MLTARDGETEKNEEKEGKRKEIRMMEVKRANLLTGRKLNII